MSMDQFLTVLTIYLIGCACVSAPFIARWWTRAPAKPAPKPVLVWVNERKAEER